MSAFFRSKWIKWGVGFPVLLITVGWSFAKLSEPSNRDLLDQAYFKTIEENGLIQLPCGEHPHYDGLHPGCLQGHTIDELTYYQEVDRLDGILKKIKFTGAIGSFKEHGAAFHEALDKRNTYKRDTPALAHEKITVLNELPTWDAERAQSLTPERKQQLMVHFFNALENNSPYLGSKSNISIAYVFMRELAEAGYELAYLSMHLYDFSTNITIRVPGVGKMFYLYDFKASLPAYQRLQALIKAGDADALCLSVLLELDQRLIRHYSRVKSSAPELLQKLEKTAASGSAYCGALYANTAFREYPRPTHPQLTSEQRALKARYLQTASDLGIWQGYSGYYEKQEIRLCWFVLSEANRKRQRLRRERINTPPVMNLEEVKQSGEHRYLLNNPYYLPPVNCHRS